MVGGLFTALQTNLGIQNETDIGVTPDPFPPPKTHEKAVWVRD